MSNVIKVELKDVVAWVGAGEVHRGEFQHRGERIRCTDLVGYYNREGDDDITLADVFTRRSKSCFQKGISGPYQSITEAKGAGFFKAIGW